MKNYNLIQKFVGKWHAAKSLAEFIKYFDNWREIWSAYQGGQPLPTFSLRGTDNSVLIQHGLGDDPIFGVAELGDDFAQFITNFQWFQPPIHPAFMQRPIFLFREIFIDRSYTPSWFYQPSADDTVIDLGANIGMFMLYLTSHSSGIKVHCFEPSARTRSKLEEQVKVNCLEKRVTVYPYAVFDKTGFTSLKLSDDSGHQSLFSSEFVGTEEEVVETISLSDAIEKCSVQEVDLLKIDVEGAEIEIVESAPEAVWKSIHRVVVEYHDLLRPGCRERVCKCLSAHGFNKIEVRTWPPTDSLGVIYAKRY